MRVARTLLAPESRLTPSCYDGLMADHTADRLNDEIRMHADVVRAHDAVHPNRDACGGFGGCRLMRAEHDAETEVIQFLTYAAQKNYTITVTVS